MNLVFVCTGNTCRSPMAAAVAMDKMARDPDRYRDLALVSCGLFAQPGAPISAGAADALDRHGLSAGDHQARQLTPDHVAAADLIVTMTGSQAAQLKAAFPEAGDKIRPLAARDIRDPFGGDADDYEEAYQDIDRAVEALLEEIAKEDAS